MIFLIQLMLIHSHSVFYKIYLLFLKLLNSHLTFVRYCLFHHLTPLAFFLLHFLFHLFLVFLIISVLLFHLIWFLNFLALISSIILYFFEGVKEKDIFFFFKELAICFDLVPKKLYSFFKSEKKYPLIHWSYAQYLSSLKKVLNNLMVCFWYINFL